MNTVGGYTFRDPALLTQALTHKSAEVYPHYERLEFVGDRVVNLCVAELLYATYPQEQEGKLAKRYTALVRTETLAMQAKQLGLAGHIVMSPGEENTGGRDKPTILADVMEAVLAAIYLDGGYDAVRTLVHQLWQPLLAEEEGLQDAKSHLQEYVQARQLDLPVYTVIASEGQDHERTFTVQVACALGSAEGTGSSKQGAGQAAAAALLVKLGESA